MRIGITANHLLVSGGGIKVYLTQLLGRLGRLAPEEEEEDREFTEMINKPISELELSVRSANCLEAANIKTIGDLVRRNESQMLKYKNFGKKSLTEINNILTGMGLHLGMDIDKKLKGTHAAQ